MSQLGDLLPSVAGGSASLVLFIYVMRFLLTTGSQATKERKRNDAMRVEVDELHDAVRLERDRAATAVLHEQGLVAELDWEKRRFDLLDAENKTLRALIRKLKGEDHGI